MVFTGADQWDRGFQSMNLDELTLPSTFTEMASLFGNWRAGSGQFPDCLT